MALSGRINGSITNSSRTGIFSYYLTWSATQSIDGNYSDVTVTAYFSTTNTVYRFNTVGSRTSSITIDGTPTSTSAVINCNPWPSNPYQIMTATKRVYHNDDGTKSITISGISNAYAAEYGPAIDSSHPCTASATVSLDSITRGAKITWISGFNDTDNPTLQYSNPLGNSVTSLQACISLDTESPYSDDIAYRDVPKTDSSYTFNFTASERNIIRSSVASANKRAMVSVVLRSVISGVTFIDARIVIVTLTENEDTKPNLAISASPYNGSLPSTFNGMYIRSKSCINISLTSSGNYNATISSVSSTVDGVTSSASSYRTALLNRSGTVSITATAIDSRGFSRTRSSEISVVDYFTPIVSPITGQSLVQCYRVNASDVASDDGTYIHIKAKKTYSSVSNKNKCTLRWRFKSESDASYGAWNTLLANNSASNEYNARITSTTFSATTSYSVQIGVLDDIGSESTMTFGIATSAIALHLGAGGKSVGIGRYADTNTEDSLKIAFDTYFEGSVHVGGKTLSEAIADAVYPVGSIYMSMNLTSPATLFGGTWERISGRFLLASVSNVTEAGDTGGSASVSLSTENLPAHTHSFSGTTSTEGSHQHPCLTATKGYASGTWEITRPDGYPGTESGYAGASAGSHYHTYSGTTSSVGSGTAHDNMPPYLVVNMWKRTS